MLSEDYIQSIREQLVKKFLDKINGLNEHKIHVFVDEDVNTGIITYKPYWLDDHKDNDGKVRPLRDRNVRIIAKTSRDSDGHTSSHWTKLINDQFIQGQRFTDHKFLLNLNNRIDNALTNYGAQMLRKYLKKYYAVDLTSDGLLVSNCLRSEDFVPAFANLIKAIQFINNNGYDFTQGKGDMLSATKELRYEEDSIQHADHDFQVAKRKHAGKSSHRKKKFTLGKISKGTSSVNGTTRDPYMKALYKREAKQRKRIQNLLSGKEPSKAKTKPKKSTKSTSTSTKKSKAKPKAKSRTKSSSSKKKSTAKKQSKSIVIKDHYFATVGTFSVSRTKLVQQIKKQGGHVQSSVNGKTNYLICNKPNKSKKYQTAVKKHIPIIKENDLQL